MKFHWGYAAVLLLLAFIIYMGQFMYRAMQLRIDDDIVETGSYEKGIRYDEHYERLDNTQKFAAKLQARQSGQRVVVQFPNLDSLGIRTASYGGQLLCYRPSNASEDIRLPVAPDSTGRQVIPVKALAPGQWLLKTSWYALRGADTLRFFDQRPLVIQKP